MSNNVRRSLLEGSASLQGSLEEAQIQGRLDSAGRVTSLTAWEAEHRLSRRMHRLHPPPFSHGAYKKSLARIEGISPPLEVSSGDGPPPDKRSLMPNLPGPAEESGSPSRQEIQLEASL